MFEKGQWDLLFPRSEDQGRLVHYGALKSLICAREGDRDFVVPGWIRTDGNTALELVLVIGFAVEGEMEHAGRSESGVEERFVLDDEDTAGEGPAVGQGFTRGTRGSQGVEIQMRDGGVARELGVEVQPGQ